jgi:hypothetical protein
MGIAGTLGSFMKQSEGGTQMIASEALDHGQVNIKCYVLPHIQNYQLKKERRVKLKIGIS